jgi:hypothetical protein
MAKRKFTDEIYAEVEQAFKQYILDHEDPIIAGFIALDPIAIKYHVLDDDLDAPAYPRLAVLSRWAIKKQEYYAVTKGMNGQAAAMAIFRLKQRQFGYTDRVDQNITSNGERVVFNNTLPRSTKSDSKVNKQSKK